MVELLEHRDFSGVRWLVRVQLECNLGISVVVHSTPHHRRPPFCNALLDAILLKHHLAHLYTLVSAHASCMPSACGSMASVSAHVIHPHINMPVAARYASMFSGTTQRVH